MPILLDSLNPQNNPTLMPDITATELGLKQYLHGTTYNGGIAPTITSAIAGFSVSRGIFIPYQLQDGSWRLKFNITITYTPFNPGTSGNSGPVLTINGIATSPTFLQTFACHSASANTYGVGGYTLTGNQIQLILLGTSNSSGMGASGDIELNAKPTWAY
jgi:hypothetical protein